MMFRSDTIINSESKRKIVLMGKTFTLNSRNVKKNKKVNNCFEVVIQIDICE